jgi:hypothetical protein
MPKALLLSDKGPQPKAAWALEQQFLSAVADVNDRQVIGPMPIDNDEGCIGNRKLS